MPAPQGPRTAVSRPFKPRSPGRGEDERGKPRLTRGGKGRLEGIMRVSPCVPFPKPHLERLLAMHRRYRDDDAGLPHRNHPRPMRDGNLRHVPSAADQGAQLAKLFLSHRHVTLVLELHHFFPLEDVPRDADEGDDRPRPVVVRARHDVVVHERIRRDLDGIFRHDPCTLLASLSRLSKSLRRRRRVPGEMSKVGTAVAKRAKPKSDRCWSRRVLAARATDERETHPGAVAATTKRLDRCLRADAR